MKTSTNQPFKYISYILIIVTTLSFGVSTLPSPASAYIDPGTGTMLIQVIAAAIFGALFTMKAWLGSLKALFVKKKASEASPGTTKEEEQK
jgi:hypothetical protein